MGPIAQSLIILLSTEKSSPNILLSFSANNFDKVMQSGVMNNFRSTTYVLSNQLLCMEGPIIREQEVTIQTLDITEIFYQKV